MFKSVFKSIAQSIGGVVGKVIVKLPFLMPIFNTTYEYAPHWLRDIFIKTVAGTPIYMPQPEQDFIWNIHLSNNVDLKVPVDANDIKTWQFAISYQWHDIGLKMIEEFLNEHISIEQVFLDIGANLGLRSLYSLSMERKTILFEPNISLRHFTEQLFSDNKFSNFTIENICLGTQDNETVKLYISKSSYLSSVLEQNARQDTIVESRDVPITKLDTYVSKNLPQQNIGLIKIDVEGFEKEVLLGAKTCLEKYRPAVMIEVQPSNSDFIFEFFKSLNYEGYGIENRVNRPLIKLDKNHTFVKGLNNYLYCYDKNLLAMLHNKLLE